MLISSKHTGQVRKWVICLLESLADRKRTNNVGFHAGFHFFPSEAESDFTRLLSPSLTNKLTLILQPETNTWCLNISGSPTSFEFHHFFLIPSLCFISTLPKKNDQKGVRIKNRKMVTHPSLPPRSNCHQEFFYF